MLTGRWGGWAVLAMSAILAAASCTAEANSTSTSPSTRTSAIEAEPQATATTSTTVAQAKELSTPQWKELRASPGWSGRPGQPWKVCGVFAPNRDVQIAMYLPDTDLMWMTDDASTVVRTDADGQFCWEGVFPTHMMDAMTQEIFPIEPGSYEVVVRHSMTGQDFAYARVWILAPGP